MLSLTSTCFAFGALPGALAADVQPFVCTGTGVADGSANVVRVKSLSEVQLTTAANGNPSVGVVLTNVKSATFKAVDFTISGVADSTNGPFVSVVGTLPSGAAIDIVLPVTAANVTTGSSSKKVHLTAASFGVKKSISTQMIVIQLYPNVSQNITNLSNFKFNNSAVKTVLSTVNECPVGSNHP